jgi:eukaryotic-like serine/threonine-protein kinase
MGAGDLHTALTSASPTAGTVRAPGSGRGRPGAGGGAGGPLVLDRYRLIRRLGSGAFGTVWMAHDDRLQRDVAVKILARERIVGGRFEREARAAARLAHPAIVTLYEAAVDDDGAYLVSELVRGTTLDRLLRDGRLSDRDVVQIAIVLCDALAHAHAQGVVHRDVKPSNVLVPAAAPTQAQMAKLTDFGVARVLGGEALTLTGDVVGTLAYMAPEQADGREAGAAADLYSLALVTYEALAGVNPNAVAVAPPGSRARRPGAQLPPLRRQRRDLPTELAAGIDRALRPRPTERGSLGDLKRALQRSHDLVDDEPGIVEDGRWLAGLTHGRRDTGGQVDDDHDYGHDYGHDDDDEHYDDEDLRDRADDDGRALRDADLGGDPVAGLDRAAGFDPAIADERQLRPSAWEAAAAEPFPWPPWLERGLAAVAATALTAWLSSRIVTPAPAPPALAALIGGCATLLAPRLGWAAVVAALSLTAAFGHHGGAAALILLGLALPIAVLPARPAAWPLAAGAPALGLIGLAGAWPALAARAGSSWRRAGLGALGWLWLLAASALSDTTLYQPLPASIPRAAVWTGSAGSAVHHVLGPLISSGVIAPAVVWAAAAALAPWTVRGRSVALDLVRVIAWSALLASSTAAAVVAVHGSDRLGGASTALVGAIVAALALLAPRTLAAWRAALRSSGPRARVP